MQKAVHMQSSAGLQLKKFLMFSVFIFLFGLFAGVFFCTGLSENNSADLSASFASSIADSFAGSLRFFLAALSSKLITVLLMLAAVLSRLLFFLPYMILWYESFAIGFCCGLIHLNNEVSALSISLTEILPPELFYIPAFIMLAAAASLCSKCEYLKSKRPSREGRSPIHIILISLSLIAVGCIVETLCHML